jgi:glycosyltransferase involved in cell wall biosynthesis
VRSMLAQDYENIEILLVDDQSNDRTLTELQKYAGTNVKVLTHSNRGFTRSIKEAIELHSNGKYIAINGSGDESASNRISRQVAFLESHLDFGLVGCGRKVCDDDGRIIKFVTSEYKLNLNTFKTLRSSVFSQGEIMFRRAIYDQVGGYRSYFYFAQDYDLWLRMNKVSCLARTADILYYEYSMTDGVRNNPEKVLLQKKYAQVAYLCTSNLELSSKIDAEQIDFKDFSMLKGSKVASNRLLRLALSSIADSKFESFNLYITESISIRRTFVSLLFQKMASNRLFFKILSLALSLARKFSFLIRKY